MRSFRFWIETKRGERKVFCLLPNSYFKYHIYEGGTLKLRHDFMFFAILLVII